MLGVEPAGTRIDRGVRSILNVLVLIYKAAFIMSVIPDTFKIRFLLMAHIASKFSFFVYGGGGGSDGSL